MLAKQFLPGYQGQRAVYRSQFLLLSPSVSLLHPVTGFYCLSDSPEEKAVAEQVLGVTGGLFFCLFSLRQVLSM